MSDSPKPRQTLGHEKIFYHSAFSTPLATTAVASAQTLDATARKKTSASLDVERLLVSLQFQRVNPPRLQLLTDLRMILLRSVRPFTTVCACLIL